MSVQASAANMKQGLSDALTSGALPVNLQSKAEGILAALNKPVRVTLMGLPGTGKSQLLNLLAGSDVIPSGYHLPTTQLVYADAPQSKCTMPDGTVIVFDHCDIAEISGLGPVFVELGLPLPALRRISVLEVVTSDDHIDQQRAMSWAAKRTDVALWCTQLFNIPEQTIWGAMPDIMKDHGFMVVTKADILSRNELLDTTLANVKAVGEHEFNQILPIATPLANEARLADGTVDKDTMRRSGGLALISAILRQVDYGQQATIDQAAILLRQTAQVAAATPSKVTPAAQENTVIEPLPDVKAAPEPTVAEAEPEPEVVVEPAPEPVAKEEVPRKAAPKSASVEEFPKPLEKAKKASPPRPTLMPGSKKAYEDAVSYLIREGRALAKAVESADKVPIAKIISRSVDNVQWLADHLQDNGEDGDPLLENARETVLDAADLIQLMQMEKQDGAVLDAVSLVVQLKHQLEADLAA